jgi:hypothetical protein
VSKTSTCIIAPKRKPVATSRRSATGLAVKICWSVIAQALLRPAYGLSVAVQ